MFRKLGRNFESRVQFTSKRRRKSPRIITTKEEKKNVEARIFLQGVFAERKKKSFFPPIEARKKRAESA